MKVCTWGNSLAVRLPKRLVESMKLEPGDELEVIAAAKGRLEVIKRERREKFIQEMDRFRFPLPEDYKFDREEANKR